MSGPGNPPPRTLVHDLRISPGGDRRPGRWFKVEKSSRSIPLGYWRRGGVTGFSANEPGPRAGLLLGEKRLGRQTGRSVEFPSLTKTFTAMAWKFI
ncbi:hypothetical protein E2C01_003223 [Portunus trituberculatus]|uniref:Uncharacterized protein n=1 Tax=Portunus trituberculatus TaxID=210409 RepID=A0A5B7CQH2_PORTR|nr:hypothetical protein [Portunus trituberculatus]